MAKIPDMRGMFTPTEPPPEPPPPQDNSDLDEGVVRGVGVGLREGEIKAFDVICEKLQISRNALLHLAMRQFLLDYRAGKIDLSGYLEEPPPARKRVRLPK